MKHFFSLSLMAILAVIMTACLGGGISPEEQARMDEVMTTSNFQQYDEAAVSDALAAGDDVVLFFHAERCGSCRRLAKNLVAEAANIPADLHIFQIDYDNSDDMKSRYGVTSQHTLVVLNDDASAQKVHNGGNDLDDVLALLN